ncbi:MAG: hypothetical protein MI861_27500, partial [Pirellulales bacterium]|nr:hypothetical protein [Pirellulales bacterium]
MRIHPFAALLFLWLPWGNAAAEVGDVLLATDHPQYPGEGVFQTPQSCVAWATRNAATEHERSLAIFQWLLTHQWHLHSPQEWCQPGRRPGSDQQDYEMVVYDANRGRFSYGYGLCGTVHAWNEAYWKAAGYQARRRAFPGHTNSEVFVDGDWRMFDTDMAGVVLNRDGSFAGYDEIIADLSLLHRDQAGLPRYPFAWPADFETMEAGWQKIASGGHWYKLYHGGYAAQPGVVHLRSGETFTRYAHPNAFGDASRRRFWHQQKDGPYRLWTFANSQQPFHQQDQSNCRGRASYGNAVFDYRPDLTESSCLEGTVEHHPSLKITPQGLRNSGDHAAAIVFHHFSPYVICGDPVDDQDPMQHPATDGLVVEGQVAGQVNLQLSPDQGQTWQDLGNHSDSFRLDCTDRVKGRYGWWLKITFPPQPTAAVLNKLRLVTTGQMCQTIYPRLKPMGCQVTYRSAGKAVVPILPRLEREQATLEFCEQRQFRSANLNFVGRDSEQRFAYRVAGPQPGQVVFGVPTSTDLVGLAAAARFGLRSPSPAGAEFRIDYSLDQGQTW